MTQRLLSSLPTSAIASELRSRRDALAAELAQLDALLDGGTRHSMRKAKTPRSTTSGSASEFTRSQHRSGPRAGNTMTLAEAITEVIGNGKKSVADIVAGVLAAGYKSRSADLHKVIGVHLAQNKKRFNRTGRGVYAVKK